MPKSEAQNQKRRNKNIKNIFIHKINSLMKIMGGSGPSLSYFQSKFTIRGKTRKSISSQNHEELLLQRKQNNKDAARKARLRKKIYMQLLEQTINNLQELNDLGKQLQNTSNEYLKQIKRGESLKIEDEIGIYLVQHENERIKKDESQATMDMEKDCSLNKIVHEIQKLVIPQRQRMGKLGNVNQKMHNICIASRIQETQNQLLEIFDDCKSVCSEHNSLLALSKSSRTTSVYDPYFCKTLMEQYYSKTLCKKDVEDIQVSKQVELLTKIQKYRMRAEEIEKCNFLQDQ